MEQERLRSRKNLVELPYRGVSIQLYHGEMSVAAITEHLMGKEAYRRTNSIVLEGPDGAYALVRIGDRNRDPLFAPIAELEVLALGDDVTFVVSPQTDCANPSALAALAEENGVGAEGTLVCQGKYDHVNYIYHPDPLVLRIVEVSPPDPPKLFHLVEQVLSYADLPPIKPVLEKIELKALASQVHPTAFLVPCRSGGLEDLGAPVRFLDQRPEGREDWTLIGCERSLQFHRHYYGDEPPRIEMCPRKIAGERDELTMLKCCLLEFHIEREGNTITVPWGSDLKMVEEALREISKDV